MAHFEALAISPHFAIMAPFCTALGMFQWFIPRPPTPYAEWLGLLLAIGTSLVTRQLS